MKAATSMVFFEQNINQEERMPKGYHHLKRPKVPAVHFKPKNGA
jgi:hypothetical protein